jgi:hypothetical protein
MSNNYYSANKKLMGAGAPELSSNFQDNNASRTYQFSNEDSCQFLSPTDKFFLSFSYTNPVILFVFSNRKKIPLFLGKDKRIMI